VETKDQIIPIKEARKLLPNGGAGLSDTQVEELINQLDFIAKLAVAKLKEKLKK